MTCWLNERPSCDPRGYTQTKISCCSGHSLTSWPLLSNQSRESEIRYKLIQAIRSKVRSSHRSLAWRRQRYLNVLHEGLFGATFNSAGNAGPLFLWMELSHVTSQFLDRFEGYVVEWASRRRLNKRKLVSHVATYN